METFIWKACAVTLLGGATLIAMPSLAQVNGVAPGAKAGQTRTVDTTEQKAQAAQNDAATTLNNTPAAAGSANAGAKGQSTSRSPSAPAATGTASGTTRHAMGVENSGLEAVPNNAPSATTDAQSQATRELNQQPPASASVNGPASGNMK
jgi:hypothetical protein